METSADTCMIILLVFITVSVIMIYLHEVGHCIAYLLLGIKNPVILFFKGFACATIKHEDIKKYFEEYFSEKGKDAWKSQIIISMPGVIVNLLWVIIYLVYYGLVFGRYQGDLMVNIYLQVIIVTLFLNFVLNILRPSSDGRKIINALKYKERYASFYVHCYSQKEDYIRLLITIQKKVNTLI